MTSAGLTEAPLCVVLDIRHPLAYLALRPAIGFARETPIDVDWLPLEGPTLLPPSPPAPSDDRSVRHKRHRANMIAREIAVYSKAQGLTLREPYRNGSPRAAHVAWLWVRARQRDALPAFLEEIFRRYWALEIDAAAVGDVAGVLRELELDADGFTEWAAAEGSKESERASQALSDFGVHQAPAFVIEGEVFYGRQHLPMIRWILEGRSGQVPI